MSKFPFVYIIILTWNRREDTLECLRSCQSITYPDYKILVVDNASTDGTVEAIRAQYPRVNVIANNRNLRFAGGNNIGIQYAIREGAEYVLLLNNDTVVDKDFLKKLVESAESDNEIGMAGPKIHYHTNPDRIWYAGGRIVWWKGLISHIGVREKDIGQYDKLSGTDYITGCCLLVKRKVIERVGMLDEAFYIYGEDSDWCVRASRAGFKLMFVPSAVIRHKVSVSTGGHFSWFKNWNKLKSQIRLLVRYAEIYHWVTIPFFLLFSIARSYLKAKES